MTHVMFIDPEVDEISAKDILIEDSPSDPFHRPCGFKVLFPCLITAKRLNKFLVQFPCFINAPFPPEVFEIVFVKPHSIEFPSKSPFQLSIFRGSSLSFLQELAEALRSFIGLG